MYIYLSITGTGNNKELRHRPKQVDVRKLYTFGTKTVPNDE